MFTLRRSEERGHADHGWLDTYHTFSFADYRDPDFTGFGPLRVLNHDLVQPGRGFGTHPHRDMEIVTYVIRGVLEHRDSMGTGSRIRPGEVQLMSAGTGVTHSEFNASRDEPLEFLQSWVIPAREGTRPRYEQRAFSDEERRNRLRLVASPDGAQGSLTIGQDVRLYAGTLEAGASVEHALDRSRRGWLHVARGALALGGHELGKGDGVAVQDESSLSLEGREDAEVIYFDLP